MMRERLREHSTHLEAQHRNAVGDEDDDVDDEEDDEDERVLDHQDRGRSRERRASTPTDDDEESIVDDFGNDSDGGFDGGAIQSRHYAHAATPEGQRLVDLVRLEADKDDAASPSQRRVNALLRMERQAVLEQGAGGPGRKNEQSFKSTRGSFKSTSGKERDEMTASFKKQVKPKESTRSSFLNFAGSFFGGPKTPGKGLKSGSERYSPNGDTFGSLVGGLTRAPSLSKAESERLFTRLHFEKLQKTGDPDPDETFKPKISKKTKRIAAQVHARENNGLPRVEYLLQRGTEILRSRKARTEKFERIGGRESTFTKSDDATIEPSHYFLDNVSGRPVKPGDSYVRAIRVIEDAEIARNKKLCTFTPKITKASRKIAEQRDRVDPQAARRGPLGMYTRGVEFLERRKREAAAAEAARQTEEEKECTFRPKSTTKVPGFMKRIAARNRLSRTGVPVDFLSDGDDSHSGIVNPSNVQRSAGWLSSPTFQLAGWRDTFRIADRFGDGRDNEGDRVNGDSVKGTDMSLTLPTAPPDHPARHRNGAHIPIHSKLSHYKFKDKGSTEADKVEAERIAKRAAEQTHAANLERLFGEVDGEDNSGINHGFGARATGYIANLSEMTRTALADTWSVANSSVTHADSSYFEKVHLERNARARFARLEKQKRLTKYDGSGWSNRVTEPKAPNLGQKPDMSGIKSLRRPLVAKRDANDTVDSPFKTKSFSLSNSVGGGVALSSGAVLSAERRRQNQGQALKQPAPPVASPLVSRLQQGSVGYFKDVEYRTISDDVNQSRNTQRGPPGWSDGDGSGAGAQAFPNSYDRKSYGSLDTYDEETSVDLDVPAQVGRGQGRDASKKSVWNETARSKQLQKKQTVNYESDPFDYNDDFGAVGGSEESDFE